MVSLRLVPAGHLSLVACGNSPEILRGLNELILSLSGALSQCSLVVVIVEALSSGGSGLASAG